MKTHELDISRGRYALRALVVEVGGDLLVAISGGERPHIGAVGAAVPRPSLRDPAQRSATSSEITFLGHKEDSVVKEVSEKLAAGLGVNVVVTAGLHWDGLDPRGIRTVQRLVSQLSQRILDHLTSGAEPAQG